MESRMRRKSHVRFGVGGKAEITSKPGLSLHLQRLSKKYQGQNIHAIAWTSDNNKELSNLHNKAMAKVDRSFHEHDRNMFFMGLIEFDEIIEKIIEAYNQSQKAS
ncbi:hypothetical protein PQ692_14995 (plasmid) [Thermoanaerobacterium thermosaccharolyticum]|uniref:hypothetical protein n=1 Tax=Thermoanaerobacterium thermosaccharolyticum TaxID=1517 RepID=UPI003D2BD4AD